MFVIAVSCTVLVICYSAIPPCRHVIYAPSSVNSYAGAVFPGVSDAIFSAQQGGGDWNQVRREMDIVRNHLRQASMIMNLPGLKYLQKM